MRKILLTTTALIALGGISAATADVNISGKLVQRYNQWSDDDAAADGANNSSMSRDLQLWIKSSAELDNGMTVGGNIRLRTGNSPADRNYVVVGGDFGSLTWGSTWAPIYSNSVGINWMDDVIPAVNTQVALSVVQAQMTMVQHVDVSSRALTLLPLVKLRRLSTQHRQLAVSKPQYHLQTLAQPRKVTTLLCLLLTATGQL